MRLFIFSLVILSIIIIGIVCNTLYMDNLTNKMLELIGNFPESINALDESAVIDELRQLWFDNIHIVAINTVTIYIIDITYAIIDVDHFYNSDSDAHYKSACEHLYQAVLRLHELERFSIDNII